MRACAATAGVIAVVPRAAAFGGAARCSSWPRGVGAATARPPSWDDAETVRVWVSKILYTSAAFLPLAATGSSLESVFPQLLGHHFELSRPGTVEEAAGALAELEDVWQRRGELPIMPRYSLCWRLVLLHGDDRLCLDPHVRPRGTVGAAGKLTYR